MQFTKRNLIKTAAVGSALLGAVAVAAPASANSFGPTDYGTYGAAMVSYKDASDQFCVRDTSPRGSVVFRVAPVNGRGPSYQLRASNGETKCVSLARAFEDTRYYYWVSDTDAPFDKMYFYRCPPQFDTTRPPCDAIKQPLQKGLVPCSPAALDAPSDQCPCLPCSPLAH